MGKQTMKRLFFIILGLFITSAALADDWKDCESNDIERAIKGCSAVINGGPETEKNLAIAHYKRGVAYRPNLRALNDFGSAIEYYGLAMALNPNDADIHYLRGDAYAAAGQIDLAIADYDEAIALSPNNARYYFARGNFYSEQDGRSNDRFKKALADYRQVIALVPASEYLSGEAHRRIVVIETRTEKSDLPGLILVPPSSE